MIVNNPPLAFRGFRTQQIYTSAQRVKGTTYQNDWLPSAAMLIVASFSATNNGIVGLYVKSTSPADLWVAEAVMSATINQVCLTTMVPQGYYYKWDTTDANQDLIQLVEYHPA